jgi:3-dehydrosphinganine reductase
MGKSVAILLAKKGANVAIIARDQRKLDLALEEIKAAAADPSTQKFLAVSADMTDHVEVKRAYDEINAWGGCPDVSWSIAGMFILTHRCL